MRFEIKPGISSRSLFEVHHQVNLTTSYDIWNLNMTNCRRLQAHPLRNDIYSTTSSSCSSSGFRNFGGTTQRTSKVILFTVDSPNALFTCRCRYINLYLDIIATADNLPLLYHLAQKAKTVRDAESHTHSEVCFRCVGN